MVSRGLPRRLTILIVIFPLISLLVYGGLTYLFFFSVSQKESHQALERYEKNFLEIEEERLKEKVSSLTQFINYYDSKSSDKIKVDVKNIVSVTASTANNIYNRYKDTKEESEIKEMIVAALKDIKFEGDIGYLFVVNLQGDVMLHVDPKLCGSNILNIQDIYGKFIIKEFNKVLEKESEGYVDYYWYIASEDRSTMHYKISYVKLLACYDWYIGAGEYLKYMRQFVQKDILDYIASNATFNHGHFFLFNGKDEIVFHPTKKKDIVLAPYKKLGLHRTQNELSYTEYIEEYDWYVVATRTLGDITQSMAKQKQTLMTKSEVNRKTNFYLLGFSWFLSLLFSLYLSTIINRLLKKYKKELGESHDKLIFQSRQALIGELFSMIAHQWRQPINKIASILALMRFDLGSKKLEPQVLDKKCEEIEDGIEFMSDTIEDFRTFYKPKTDEKRVNLKTIIEQALVFMESSIVKKDIMIVTQLQSIEYKLYQNEFLQVMLNLIKNSIDSIEREGKIIIKLFSKKGEVFIIVEDNGKGIEDKMLSKIFDPYYTTKEDSMGLGLYMSKMIIEKHMQGDISLETMKEGVRFIIRLKL